MADRLRQRLNALGSDQRRKKIAVPYSPLGYTGGSTTAATKVFNSAQSSPKSRPHYARESNLSTAPEDNEDAVDQFFTS